VLAVAFALVLAAAPPAAPDGARLYLTHCAACHAPQAWGSADGPSLRGIGSARLDFYLITGRMPAAAPWVQIGDRDERIGQRLPLADIRAIERYLAPTVAGGPAIPLVAANGDVERGRHLYQLNCEHCHAAEGIGGDLGKLDWVPSLRGEPINVVADAVRAGPGEMPRFSEHQLSQTELDDVASYVVSLAAAPHDGAPPFRSTGPVPEGAAGYLAIIALVAFVFTFWRVDTPARKREEAVRRDEGDGAR
jgi:ubiquinol-cytochrome c reductase cytochrome c subunit